MTRILLWLGAFVALLALAAGGFWMRYLRDLPQISVALHPLDLANIEPTGLNDCFWIGPVTSAAFNIAFPDEGAIYWPTVFTPPAAGDYLEIQGRFPRARYMSFNTYGTGAAPHDHLTDTAIAADPGATNPYRTGHYGPEQSYTIRVLPGPAPDPRPQNTLYWPQPTEIDAVPLILRLYLPETASDPTGGAGLPRVTLVRRDGSRLTGEALCTALGSAPIGSRTRTIEAPLIPADTYRALFDTRAVRTAVIDAPGGRWNLFWSPQLAVLRTAAPALADLVSFGARLGLVPRRSGFYANRDNDYVSTYINERFGEIAVLDGRLPRTPATGIQAAADGHDMRYWSLCTNEGLASTRFAACVHDHQVVTNDQRRYVIAVSKPANRPANARHDCGVTWLDWGDAGDGAGHEHLGVLILRNMLPEPGFGQAIQSVPRPGDEASVMGDYLPTIHYESREDFEERGC